MSQQTIAIASDHAGYEMKEALKAELLHGGYRVEDLGAQNLQSVDYPDFANKIADHLKHHPDAYGVLICGSGIGMSIAANRHKHIRAALCMNGLSASLARKHNNANVLCLGARLIGIEVAKRCLKEFLESEFEGGRHEARVKKLGA